MTPTEQLNDFTYYHIKALKQRIKDLEDEKEKNLYKDRL